jgi:hypothetical protein
LLTRRNMRRVSSILAHVLATTAIGACGGATADIQGDPQQQPPPSGIPTTCRPGHQPPVSTDAGPATDSGTDAGCNKPAVLVGNRGCSDVYHQVCGIPAGVDPSDGMSAEECAKVCGPNPKPFPYWGCSEYMLDDLPGPSFECYTCVEGRRPQGYVEQPLVASVAGWLAHAADLERVSIDAFQILQRELRHHGAPAALVALAAGAEADEVRHARILTTMARREGATPSSVPIAHGDVRALVDIALENAVEGCIRETFGALVAGWQSQHASRKDVAGAMKGIYRDETRHADLAWQVHAWLMESLDAADRARVERAMVEAIGDLAAASEDLPQDVTDALGLPGAADTRRLVRALHSHLWSLSFAA